MRELLPDDGSQEDWKPRIKRFLLDLETACRAAAAGAPQFQLPLPAGGVS